MKKSKLLGAALAATMVSSAFAVTSISASAIGSGSGIDAGDSVGIVGSFNNWGNSGESDIPMTYNNGVWEGTISIDKVTEDMVVAQPKMVDGTGNQVPREDVADPAICFKIRTNQMWGDSWGDYDPVYDRTWNSQTECAVSAEVGKSLVVKVKLDTTKTADGQIVAEMGEDAEMAWEKWAVSYEAVDFSYDYAENEDGTITLYGFKSEEAADICVKGGDFNFNNPPVYVIPDKIDGKTVTRIAYNVDGKDAMITTEDPNLQSEVHEKSFRYALEGYKIKLPDTIKELGDFAFMNMEFVDDKLPEGLERIGISSCSHVRNKKLVMPSTLKYIGSEAFAECDLKEIIFNEGLEYIGSYAFCVLPPFASEITIPKSVKYLGWDFIYSWAWSADPDGKSWYQTDIQYNIYGGGFVEQYMKTYVPFHREGIPAGYNYKVIGQIDAVPAQTEKVNGLKVSGAIPEGAEFKAVSTTTKWLKDPLFCYEITMNKDGKEVQPDGYITISIPCEYGNGYVVCINEETGEMENLNSIYCDGYYVFVTDHLSQYGIKFDSDPVKAQTSEPQQSDPQQSEPQQSQPQQSQPQQSQPQQSQPQPSQTVTPVQPNNTPKTADTTPFFAAVFAVAVSAAAVIALRKRKA